MVARTIHSVLDDVDGTEGAQSHTFGLDGVTYEIDLADQTFSRLLEGLTEFIDHGRRIGKAPKAVKVHANGNGTKPATVATTDTKVIRQWWRESGRTDLPVFGERGRVPAAVTAAYENRDNQPEEPTAPTRKPRSKRPSDEEIAEVFKLTGTKRGVADHFDISYPTAGKWVDSLI